MKIVLVDERDDPPSTGSLDTAGLTDLARLTLQGEGIPDNAELAITLVEVGRMAELNQEHMGRTGPTDVLAFPLEDLVPGEAVARPDGGPPLAVGDIVICPEVVEGNARRHDAPFEAELALMVVHGTLHLLGYDHVVDDEAEVMEAREREHLSKVGLTRP